MIFGPLDFYSHRFNADFDCMFTDDNNTAARTIKDNRVRLALAAIKTVQVLAPGETEAVGGKNQPLLIALVLFIGLFLLFVPYLISAQIFR